MLDSLKYLASRREVTVKELSGQSGAFLLEEGELLRLQAALLDMYKDIYAVCSKYGIIPYLSGGSALGAIRHRGFIPWDDDLDIAMTREDYYVLRSVFKKELGDRYILNAPNYSRNPKSRFPKIMKKGTICRGIDDYSDDRDCGIFVDIFLIENVPDPAFLRMIKGTFCNALEFIGSQVSLRENPHEQILSLTEKEGKAVSLIRRGVGSAFGVVRASAWYHGIDKAVRWNKPGRYIAFPTGRRHYFGEILPRSILEPVRYIPFCDMEAPVFGNAEAYLANLYGDDYMQLPPEEKRERHYLIRLQF